jgi:hypothetical protein
MPDIGMVTIGAAARVAIGSRAEAPPSTKRWRIATAVLSQ